MDLEELRGFCAEAMAPQKEVIAAYLFGSRAKGKPNPKDYDIALLLDESIVKDASSRYQVADQLFVRLYQRVRPLDVVILNGATDTLVEQVLRHNEVLYCIDDVLRVEWEVRSRYKIWDMAPFREVFERAAIARARRAVYGDGRKGS